MFQDEKFWQRRENVERRQEPVEKDHRCNQLLAIKIVLSLEKRVIHVVFLLRRLPNLLCERIQVG